MSAVDVVAIRRDLHAHPELAFQERRTTEVIVGVLNGIGLNPTVLPAGTGAICDIGTGTGPVIALRADIDALPIVDLKDVAYRSSVEGVCHGCGHDAHTAILLAAAEQIASSELPGRIRMIFQPAEESLPGGALSVLQAGALADVAQIYALHCDPRLDTGQVGVRVGPITAACDELDIALSGPGGHTARPHLTVDLVYALGQLITELPGMLSRCVDPRASLSLVWGAVQAGRASNAIPASGQLRGTVRAFDREAWDGAQALVCRLAEQIVAPSGARATVSYVRGVPPVDNDPDAVEVQRAAILDALGADCVAETVQSMGGEDFAWYLQAVPGALARLGVRRPGQASFDLHQATFDIDEDALGTGVLYTVALARRAVAALSR